MVKGPDKEVVQSFFANTSAELLAAHFSERVSGNWYRAGGASAYNRFYFFLGGEGRLCIDGTEYAPLPGQLYLVPAETPIAYSTLKVNRFSKHWCHFAAKIGDFHLFRLLKFPPLIDVMDIAGMIQMFERLERSFRDNGNIASPFKTKSALLDIISYYVEHAPRQSIQLSASPASDRFNQILKYIDAHLAETLSLERLATAFGYNPNYFVRYFKSMFQISPNQYIVKARIERAKRLLVQSDDPLDKIADAIGMERFYFSKVFKQMTSYSPSQYRSMNKKGPSANS